MKWGQRAKLDELMLHKARLAQRQLFHEGTRLFDRGHVQEENGTCLCLANPPLVDLACQIQSKRSRHFLRKDFLYLLRRWRLRELSDSQNLCCRDYWENRLRHFLGVSCLVLNVLHIQFLPSIRDCGLHLSVRLILFLVRVHDQRVTNVATSQSFSLSIHSRIYGVQFSSFTPSASQPARKAITSRPIRLTSFRSRTMSRRSAWNSRSLLSSSIAWLSIRPLRMNTVNFPRGEIGRATCRE